MEKRLLGIVEDRFASLKGDVSKESRNRYESIEHLKSCLENDFPKL
jgi:glutamyl-tRNA reductase